MASLTSKCRPVKWADMSERQRVALVVASAVQLALATAAWTDLRGRSDDELRGPKWRWAIAIAVNWIGPLSYFAWGRRPASSD